MEPIVSSSSIKVIAESVGIAALKDEVADALAPDVEYRLRALVQEAIKFMKHGRRDTLTMEDINYALRLRNCEPLYGFASPATPRFCRAGPGVFYLEDPCVPRPHHSQCPPREAIVEPFTELARAHDRSRAPVSCWAWPPADHARAIPMPHRPPLPTRPIPHLRSCRQ